MWLLCTIGAPVQFWIWASLTLSSTSQATTWIDKLQIEKCIPKTTDLSSLKFCVFFFWYWDDVIIVRLLINMVTMVIMITTFSCLSLSLFSHSAAYSSCPSEEWEPDAALLPSSREFSYYLYSNDSSPCLYFQPWLRHLWGSGESHLVKEYGE